MRKELIQFYDPEDPYDDCLCVAEGIRHLFAHGSLSSRAAGLQDRAEHAENLRKLAKQLSTHVDNLFTEFFDDAYDLLGQARCGERVGEKDWLCSMLKAPEGKRPPRSVDQQQ